MSNSYSEKAYPSSIYTRFNTRYVIPLFSYTDTLFEWSQMKIIKLEFPIFWYETFFMFKTSLLLLNFCLCVYMNIKSIRNLKVDIFKNVFLSFKVSFWLHDQCRAKEGWTRKSVNNTSGLTSVNPIYLIQSVRNRCEVVEFRDVFVVLLSFSGCSITIED